MTINDRHIKISLDSAHRFGCPAPIEAMLLNAGAKAIGEIDDVVTFDYTLHEDMKGGLINGDKAKVIRLGFRYSGGVISRAHVIPVPPVRLKKK